MNWSSLCKEEVWTVEREITVDLVGRNLVVARDIEFATNFHESLRTLNVSINKNFWTFDRTVDMRLGGKIDNNIRLNLFK